MVMNKWDDDLMTERPILAMFFNPTTGHAEYVYDDPEPPPPPSRADELRTAIEHLRLAASALRRALGDGPGPQTRSHA
jgi:hypothetical protein